MRLVLLPLLAAVIQVQSASAEVSDETLRRKISDLHDDNIPGNCGDSMTFLREHSNEKKVQNALLSEFNKTTDPQTKEECMVLLCHAPGFQLDEQFMRAVIKRMHHHGKPKMMSPSDEPAGNAGAMLLVTQIRNYPDLILSEIKEASSIQDLWVQYAIIRALAKAGLLKTYENRFSESYLKRLADHLQDYDTPQDATTADDLDDAVPQDARIATCAFLFLGKIGVPALRALPRSSNLRGRQLALALLSYFSGGTSLTKLSEKVSKLGVGFNPEDIDSKKNDHIEALSMETEDETSSPAEDSDLKSVTPNKSVQATALPEFRAELEIFYSYKGKTPPAARHKTDYSEGDIISADERENLGISHAVNSGGETAQQLEGSSKLAPIRFSVRVERKAGEPDAKLTISVEDSTTGKALDDFPKVQEDALELLQQDAGHHVQVSFSPAQEKKIAEVLRAAVLRDEGEARAGLKIEGGFILIGR